LLKQAFFAILLDQNQADGGRLMAAEAKEKSQKNKKIKKMTLTEIDAKLEEIKKNEGGLLSRYARHLLARKQALLGQK